MNVFQKAAYKRSSMQIQHSNLECKANLPKNGMCLHKVEGYG